VQKVQLKRGDTLIMNVTATSDTGSVADLTGWTVRAQLRQGNTLVDTLVYTAVDLPNGRFTLKNGAAGTTGYPVSTLVCDIEYTDPSGVVASTETFGVQVLADVTQ
jgi:hypothetical protein